MPRKVSLPGASELFRATKAAGPTVESVGETKTNDMRTSGRVRHDEKITVYVSRDELIALERARLTLRADHSVCLDRGRFVREAIAVALEDLEIRGADSDIVRRLSEQ